MNNPNDLGCVFLSRKTYGGHEKMAVKYVRGLVSRYRKVVCYVSPYNSVLLDDLYAIKGVEVNLIACSSGLGRYQGLSFPVELAYLLWKFFRGKRIFSHDKTLVIAGGLEQAVSITTLGRILRAQFIVYTPFLALPHHHRLFLGYIRSVGVRLLVGGVKNIVSLPNQEKSLPLWGWVPETGNYVENFFDSDEFGIESTSTIQVDYECFNVVVPGRIDFRQKGQDRLISIIKRLGEVSRANMVFHFIGDGRDRDRLEVLCNRSRIGKHVVFHGFVKLDMKTWKKFDCVLLPSRIEASQLVLLEAIRAERIVLSTNVGIAGKLLPADNLIDFDQPQDVVNKIASYADSDMGFHVDRSVLNEFFRLTAVDEFCSAIERL
ncbi:glycosyltransferase [Actomonas aquatica]|uniref:Glycosyltransferase n=1 Tax=Actomonas aquatica TaxID=2866162 RepID=A0ABZ1CAB4_9BACT|nr:glycosyltransferase [Opitutus sp. WL0086]WRQ88585.1 glycosyltransferase [Opitutus sp. WL0086]